VIHCAVTSRVAVVIGQSLPVEEVQGDAPLGDSLRFLGKRRPAPPSRPTSRSP
jgi:hypothetical protein